VDNSTIHLSDESNKFAVYRNVLIASDELPLAKDDNRAHARLLEQGWRYHRTRGSYSTWFRGGFILAANQRIAWALARVLEEMVFK
jgi:hypothetical protein